jgi:hypothetical protein
MVACLGSFIAASLVGVLVLARSTPLAGLVQGRRRTRCVAHATAILTALFVAGMAGLAVFMILSNFSQ